MNSRGSDQSVLPSPSGPVLCATGCGFFGNPNTDNLCSKCNNDRKRRQAAAESSPSPATATVTATPSPALVSTSSPATSTSSPATPTLAPLAISESAISSTSSPAVDAAAILSPAPSSTATAAVAAATSSPIDAPSSTSTPKKKLNRCGICSKKVGITYFNCRCDDTLLLCSAHRLPHQHDCKFDLKKLHTANLTKANPEIVKAKMEKI